MVAFLKNVLNTLWESKQKSNNILIVEMLPIASYSKVIILDFYLEYEQRCQGIYFEPILSLPVSFYSHKIYISWATVEAHMS